MECWINLLVWNASELKTNRYYYWMLQQLFSSEWTERVPMTRREMFRGIFGFRRKRPSPEEKTKKIDVEIRHGLVVAEALPSEDICDVAAAKKGKRKSGDSSSYGLVDPVAIPVKKINGGSVGSVNGSSGQKKKR